MPQELSSDQNSFLDFVNKNKGCITKEQIQDQLKWSMERLDPIIHTLLSGMTQAIQNILRMSGKRLSKFAFEVIDLFLFLLSLCSQIAFLAFNYDIFQFCFPDIYIQYNFCQMASFG